MNTEVKNQLQISSSLLNYLILTEKDKIKLPDKDLIKEKQKLLMEPVVKNIMDELLDWPGNILKRHNDAKLLIHKLAFIADLGLNIQDDDRLKRIADKILEHESPEGVFQIKVNIPIRFGGTGEDQFSWMLCDAPLLLYSLVKLGVNREKLKKGLNYLFSLAVNEGFPCAASADLGRFNGPGKRGTLCPYANLLMVKLFTLLPERLNSIECKNGVEALLDHWETRDKKYLFGIGTDFKKLKFPFIWYDILHVTEVLSHFEYAVKDRRFKEMISCIKGKADSDQLFKAESVWMAWKCIDSGQKKTVSNWITYMVYRILERVGE